MKIIVTNDDGIDAPGLEVLVSVLKKAGRVIVVAPAEEQSGVGHSVTAYSPIQIKEESLDRFKVYGTPADCSRIALKHLATDADWVVAGINPGANLGSDVYNSGTVAAAREAAILGKPSMAVSQYIAKNHFIDWGLTQYHIEPVIHMLLKKTLKPKHFWNVNLPHPLDNNPVDFNLCSLDVHPHKYHYRQEGSQLFYEGIIHDRPRDPDRDVAVCFGGKISITQIAIGICK